MYISKLVIGSLKMLEMWIRAKHDQWELTIPPPNSRRPSERPLFFGGTSLPTANLAGLCDVS